MVDKDELAREIDANLEFFKTQLEELLKQNRDRYALLHNRQIVGIYDTIIDAKTAGDTLYPNGIFSIQEITDKPFNLGVFSYAMHMGAA